MKIKGWDLSFFSSGEWQVCDERLKDLEKVYRKASTSDSSAGGYTWDGYNPGRERLFEALRRVPSSGVKVCIVGQDPYPDRRLATGVAFSIPQTIEYADWPPTLKNFLTEYKTDLRQPLPSHGGLDGWSDRGVLLWNAIPSVGASGILSHDWGEWAYLTREIISILSERGVVFAFLGQVARRFISGVDLRNNSVICTSHPSPRGSINSKTPFIGSRLFSTINDRLNDSGAKPVDWKL